MKQNKDEIRSHELRLEIPAHGDRLAMVHIEHNLHEHQTFCKLSSIMDVVARTGSCWHGFN